jgi:hypothetical protein
MINDLDIRFAYEGIVGVPLAWVIEEDCLYDLPLNQFYSNIFLTSDFIDEVSHLYPDLPGITVRLYKDGEIVEDFNTSEYFGSILLSPHKVINLNNHAYGYYLVSPNGKFIDNKFIILDQDMTYLSEFRNDEVPECTPLNCQCYKENNV